ncbi:PHD finger protein 20-like isoform X1, partial [Lates japonicus]
VETVNSGEINVAADSTQPATPNPPTLTECTGDKNQPPPILSIEVGLQPFVSCRHTKSFRSESATLPHQCPLTSWMSKAASRGGTRGLRVPSRARTQAQQEEGCVERWGCCRRKRSSSEGSDFMSDRKNENRILRLSP